MMHLHHRRGLTAEAFRERFRERGKSAVVLTRLLESSFPTGNSGVWTESSGKAVEAMLRGQMEGFVGLLAAPKRVF